jgi:hypothetical protein
MESELPSCGSCRGCGCGPASASGDPGRGHHCEGCMLASLGRQLQAVSLAHSRMLCACTIVQDGWALALSTRTIFTLGTATLSMQCRKRDNYTDRFSAMQGAWNAGEHLLVLLDILQGLIVDADFQSLCRPRLLLGMDLFGRHRVGPAPARYPTLLIFETWHGMRPRGWFRTSKSSTSAPRPG